MIFTEFKYFTWKFLHIEFSAIPIFYMEISTLPSFHVEFSAFPIIYMEILLSPGRQIQCSSFITHLVITWIWIKHSHVVAYLYHGILQRNYRKMTIFL